MTRDEVIACVIIAPRLLKRWPQGVPCPASKTGPCRPYLEDDETRCELWQCEKCQRWVPACFGGADRHPDCCDNCWAELERGRCDCPGPVQGADAKAAFDPDMYDCTNCGHLLGFHDGPNMECSHQEGS